ncbi:fatty acid desaturase [Lysobacter brunescens]
MIAGGAALYLATSSAISLWTIILAYMGCIVLAGSIRYHQTVLMHHAAHGMLFKSKPGMDSDHPTQAGQHGKDPRNLRYASIASCMFLLPSPEDYHEEHIAAHHKTLRIFATTADPDAAFLLGLGFIPGTSVAKQRWLLLRTLLSPRLHARMAWQRICSAGRPSMARKIGVMTTLSMLLLLILLEPAFGAMLTFALFPVVHCAALFQFTTEHLWFSPMLPGESANCRAARLSHARFSCDPTPSSRLGWIRWWARLLTLHLTMRVLALNGDLPQHDMHHLRPNADFQKLGALRWELYDNDIETREYWGYGAVLTAVMQHIEEAGK